MPSRLNARSAARLLAATDVPLWIIGADGRLVQLSEAAAAWLHIDANELIDRHCVAGTASTEDPRDRLAASLSPPPGLAAQGWARLWVQPPDHSGEAIAPQQVAFIRIGSDDSAVTLAVAGNFAGAAADLELAESTTIRQLLDTWRKRQSAMAVTVTAGTSPSARRLRARLQIAAQIRSHLGLFGPEGSGAETIATRIHQLSAPGEAIVVVEGPLMDAELLEATIAPAIHLLGESIAAKASVLVRAIDEMPIEAQSRLAEVLASMAGRMRLIGLCGPHPELFREPIADAIEPVTVRDEVARRLEPRLAELLSVMHVTIEPFANRVEDLPLIAAALLDARHARGEGPAERISRAALDAIVTYPWPGNFVELDAAMRHAIRASTIDTIAVDHLPLAVRTYRAGQSLKTQTRVVSLDRAVRRYELRLIQEAIEAADGNRAEAARRLGVSRARLLRRLDEAPDDAQARS